MIIDSHIHFGKAINWDLPEQDLIRYIYEYNIDYAIISNVSGVEFDHDMKKIDMARQYPQIQLNERTARLVKEYPSKLKGLFWIKPHIEGYTKELEDFLEKNKQYFCGMKIHTYHSAMKITDKRMIPYILLCKKFNWPCVIHSGGDVYSSPKSISKVAEAYPDVNFVMVHLGSGENHTESIELIEKLPNLYGDTTWVAARDIVKTIKMCGSHKVLFGTDAIVQGVDTANRYIDTINYLKAHLKGTELEDVFCNNAMKIFNLKLKCKEIKSLY